MNEEILLIDSDRNGSDALELLLQAQEFQTLQAFNGEQAITEIKKGDIDLVLLDHEHLPDQGLVILREITEIDPAIQMIILSRDTSFDSAIDALRRNVSDYLAKPCADEKLMAPISRALTQRSRQWQRNLLSADGISFGQGQAPGQRVSGPA